MLLSHEKAIYVDMDLRKKAWEHWCVAAGVKVPDTNKRIYFQSSTQALQACVSGLGVMVTHAPFIQDDVQAGQLAKLSDVTVERKKAFYLVFPEKQLSSERALTFMRWLLSASDV